jgi:hypothetical protein
MRRTGAVFIFGIAIHRIASAAVSRLVFTTGVQCCGARTRGGDVISDGPGLGMHGSAER